MSFSKSIGVFGGAGPWASAHAVMTIVQKAQWDYGAVHDDDYPAIVLRSVPLKGFGAGGVEDRTLVFEQLFCHFNRFAADRIDIALMACNSLHVFHGALQSAFPAMDIVNLPEEGAAVVASRGYRAVGVLSSDSAREDGLHQAALEARGVRALLPDADQQEKINILIRRVMGGNTGAEEAQIFRRLSREFAQAGAQVLLSGCTELSYLSQKFQSDVPVIDCLYVSLETAMRRAWTGPVF